MHTTTIRKKDSGYQIIISYKDASGKWRQKSKQGFALRKDAKAAESKLLEEIRKQPRPVEKSMEGITLREFSKEVLKNKASLVYASKDSYISAVKSLSDLADKPIKAITFLDLQQAIREWKIKPLTQKQYKAKLDIIFRMAVKPYGLIASNPMQDIEIAKQRKKKQVVTLTIDAFQELLKDLSKDPEIYTAVNIGWYTGMRRAEIVALTWDDIDLQNATLSVNKQFAKTAKNTYKVVSYAKSRNGIRQIPIPLRLVKVLKDYRASVPLRLDKALFGYPHKAYRRFYIAMTAHATYPHALRHSYATKLLAENVDVQTVAALLGDNVQTVINTYIHYTDEMRSSAQSKVQKIFA